LIIVGGGLIGVELAQAFTRLGTKVVLIQGPERLLPKEDPEVSATIAGVLRASATVTIRNPRRRGMAQTPDNQGRKDEQDDLCDKWSEVSCSGTLIHVDERENAGLREQRIGDKPCDDE
jgi:pyruvate/2-oxoglutarate dehydrogenase complex dihydrolipoamide dehydrogenase (E3) component